MLAVLLSHLQHFLLYAHQLPFWRTWLILTAAAGISTALLCRQRTYSLKHAMPKETADDRRIHLSRSTVVLLTVLALFLGGYTVVVLVWEDFSWYDSSQFTTITLRGIDYPVPIWPEVGRFFPLGLQEFNVIRHFTNTVTGYHAFPVVELFILATVLVFLDEQLSMGGRVFLAIISLLTPSAVDSLTGLIYPERNVLLFLACFALFVKKFEQLRSAIWAVAAVLSAQVMLYLKEPVFLLLLSFAGARVVLRCRTLDAAGWNFNRLREAESRLDYCIAAVSVVFVVYYGIAMFPHTEARYLVDSRVPMPQAIRFYLKSDMLAWVFAGVVMVRMCRIVRGKAAPRLLWDGLACGGLVYFAAYLGMGMARNYYLAPVDLIAVLYTGRLALLSWLEMGLELRVATATLVALIACQNFALSAYHIVHRKYFIQRTAATAHIIIERYKREPDRVRQLYFPFTASYLSDFAAYLSFRGLPVEEAGAPSGGGDVVRIFGGRIAKDGRCVMELSFVCHAGTPKEAGSMTVVLPDDPLGPGDQMLYKESEEKLQSYEGGAQVPELLMRAWHLRGRSVEMAVLSRNKAQ